jgi:hypothetical protein
MSFSKGQLRGETPRDERTRIDFHISVLTALEEAKQDMSNQYARTPPRSMCVVVMEKTKTSEAAFTRDCMPSNRKLEVSVLEL